MTVQPISSPAWEALLLDRAQNALVSARGNPHPIEADEAALCAAYQYCELITRDASRTFHLASGLLPNAKKRAARALYAFCRITDNIVDESDDACSARESLDAWRRLSLDSHPTIQPRNIQTFVALAWADARARYQIPIGYAEQLIDGVAHDLDKTRYQTFDELAAYSYGVASTVGLMAMHIIGFAGEHALPYAVKLGVALQMTNILRDVGEDWTMGRLYLPLDELAAFGLSEMDIAEGAPHNRWREFMRFQVERNRQLYHDAMPGIALLNAEGRFAISAAAELYCAILDDIQAHDYRVFTRRAHVSTPNKVRRLPGIWWRSRSGRI